MEALKMIFWLLIGWNGVCEEIFAYNLVDSVDRTSSNGAM